MQTTSQDRFADSVTVNGGTPRFYFSMIAGTEFSNNLYITGSNVSFSMGEGSNVFSGGAKQVISSSSMVSFKYMVINKSNNTVTLQAPITITNTLDFVNGNIITDTTHLLTFASGSSWLHGGNKSFVSGPVKKIGSSAFTFPIGAGYSKSIAGISAPANAADAYMAQYFEGENPLGNTLDTTLQAISNCGYWKIARTNGTSNIKITLGWDTMPCLDYCDSNVKMAVWKNSKWQQINIDTTTANTNNLGRITSSANVADFGYFIFANVFKIPVNVGYQGASKAIHDYFGFNIWDVVETPDVSLGGQGNQNYLNAAINLSPGTLRFPAGIEANWWDWKKGGFVRDRTFNNIPYLLPQQFNTIELREKINSASTGLPADMNEFFKSVYATGSTPIYSLNDLSSDVLYQASMLFHATSKNIPNHMFELGGEIYKVADYNDIRFPTGKEYVEQSIEWSNKIKVLYGLGLISNTPDFQFGIVASKFNPFVPTDRVKTWNSKMFNQIDAYEQQNFPNIFKPAVIIHDYIGTGLFNNPPNLCPYKDAWVTTNYPNLHRIVSPFDISLDANGSNKPCYNDMELIFASVFRNFAGEATFTDYKGFLHEELDENSTHHEKIPGVNTEIWITEYNDNGSAAIFDGTWAQGLSVALQTMLYLEAKRVTRVSCFRIIGSAIFAAVFGSANSFDYNNEPSPNLIKNSSVTTALGEKTAIGHSLGLLAKAMRNADNAQQLSFTSSGNLPKFDYYKRFNETALEPQVYGWYFTDASNSEEQIVILNLSEKTILLDCSLDIPGDPMFEMDGYEQIYGDPAGFVTGIGNNFNFHPLHLFTPAVPLQIPANRKITLEPYSIMRLYKKPCNVVLEALTSNVCSNTTSSLTAFVHEKPTAWIFDWETVPSTTNVTLANTSGVPTPTGSTNTFTVNPLLAANTTVTFKVTATNSGCTTSSTVTVNLKKAPVLNVTTLPTPATVCATNTVAFTMYLTGSTSNWANYVMINSFGQGVDDYEWTTGNTPATININPTTSADYTVYAYDGVCALSHSPIVVNVPEMELGDNVYVCNNANYTFTDENVNIPPSATSYSWASPSLSLPVPNRYPTFNVSNTAATYTLTAHYGACTLQDEITLYPITCCSTTSNLTLDNLRINDADFATHCGTFYHLNTDETTITIKPTTGTPNINININGRLTVKGKNLRFENCNINMSEASEILVDTHYVCSIFRTTLNECNNIMWKGVTLGPSAKLTTSPYSTKNEINGAEYAVNGSERSVMDLQNASFNKNFISVFFPSIGSNRLNFGTLSASDAQFSCASCNTTPLPDNYISQTTAPGNYSFAGIVVNDLAGTIGVTGQDPVEFNGLNNGIIGINSSLLVQNTTFTSVKPYDNTYTMPFNTYNGNGIFVGADLGKFASLTQIGLGSTTTFYNGGIGISTLRASQNVSRNTMRNMLIGIRSLETNLLSTDIFENDIQAYFAGIHMGNSIYSRRVNLTHNTISTYLPGGWNIWHKIR